MNSNTIAAMLKGSPGNPGYQGGSDGVVEIDLLLPARRAAALLRLAKDRHVSVGQLLRGLIDREIAESH